MGEFSDSPIFSLYKGFPKRTDMKLSPTTELEAVNAMLAGIGESPVNSLDSGYVDAETAHTILTSVAREVQERGWTFNTELSLRLIPNNEGEITLPRNCLKVDTTGVDLHRFLVQRGTKLYDPDKHTYKHEKGVEVDMVVFLDFSELPEVARNYITIRAGRLFQDRIQGSGTLHDFQLQDEYLAKALLEDSEGFVADYNIFNDPQVASGRGRVKRHFQNRF